MFAEINAVNQKFILIFFRTAAILWFLPIFSSRAVAVYFKAGFSLALAFLLFQTVEVAGPLGADAYSLILLVLREILIGISIGFMVRVLFTVITAAGDLIAFQSGFSFAQFMDPITNTQVSPLVHVINLMAMLIFFVIDAHHTLIRGIAASFRDLPIGTGVFASSLVEFMTGVTAKVFTLGLKIGAPVVVTLFLVELALGLLSRMIPQVNIFVEGVPLKILIALTIFSLTLSVIAPAIATVLRSMEGEMLRMFRLMAT